MNYTEIINSIYTQCQTNPIDTWINNADDNSWSEHINTLIDLLFDYNNDYEIDYKELSQKVAELFFLQLCTQNKQSQNTFFKNDFISLLRKLENHPNPTTNILSKYIWESLIIGLDVLNSDTIQSIINELAELTDTDLGNSTIRNNSKTIKFGKNSKHFEYLSTTVSKEVASFLNERENKTIPPNVIKLINRISSPVVSVASRKGGTGKTTFLLNTINWFYDRFPKRKACIIDLDLSGPVWLYLLAEKSQLNYIKSSKNFLDIFFDTKKAAKDPYGLEIDTSPKYSEVFSTVNTFKWPFNKSESSIGLCTFQDIPYTNRQIDSALNYNRNKFYPFLINFISHLSKEYDLILVDAGPGFSAIPYCSLSIAGIVKNSIPVVIGSPALCDLYGTLMEFADLKFINSIKPPTWWINKVNGHEYFKKELNWYTLSKDLGLVNELPHLPIIKTIQETHSEKGYKWKNLPFDEKITHVGTINQKGEVNLPELNCENSRYYQTICEYFDKENTDLVTHLNSKS